MTLPEPNITEVAETVLTRRYLLREPVFDDDGNVIFGDDGKPEMKIIETPAELIQRVALAISDVELYCRQIKGNYCPTKLDLHSGTDGRISDEEWQNIQDNPDDDRHRSREHWAEKFHDIIGELRFLPNSPALMNAGTKNEMCNACFVLSIEDSIDDIFMKVGRAAKIFQMGGGVGYDFGHLRQKNALVMTSMGLASGPVSFMKPFDAMTTTIEQGGKRRGANMAVMPIDHPDVELFIDLKKVDIGHMMAQFRQDADPIIVRTLIDRGMDMQGFNISVAITEKFMRAVLEDADFELNDVVTGKPVKTVKAKKLFEKIAYNAWESGEPGILFMDQINKMNPSYSATMFATNPCGEQCLEPDESCNLGSIDISQFVITEDKVFDPEDPSTCFDTDRLSVDICTAVRFLDNVVDKSAYPYDSIRDKTLSNRRIGLGIMGWADSLCMLGISYDSEEAVRLARSFMKFFNAEAMMCSSTLAAEKGVYPEWKDSYYCDWNNADGNMDRWGLDPDRCKWFEDKNGLKRGLLMRNITVTTIAPTGTISMIAGCSSGIEPLMGVVSIKTCMDDTRLPNVNEYFVNALKKDKMYKKSIVKKICAKGGSCATVEEIPGHIRRVFKTGRDIDVVWHILHQGAFQKYCQNSISKTCNLYSDAEVDDVVKAYLHAWSQKCKGITVYRDGARGEGVFPMNFSEDELDLPGIVDDTVEDKKDS